MERNELKKVSIKIFDDIIKIEDFNFDSKSYKNFLIYIQHFVQNIDWCKTIAC